MKNELELRYPALSVNAGAADAAVDMIGGAFRAGGKLLICGNGGSFSDALHIEGELLKSFKHKRPLPWELKDKIKSGCPSVGDDILDKLEIGLPAMALNSPAYSSAFCNDVEPSLVYAQHVLAVSSRNDVLLCISTSGNSKNVVCAAMIARGLGLSVISLTGRSGGKLKELSDILINVPEDETYKIQELHLPVYHYICAQLENKYI